MNDDIANRVKLKAKSINEEAKSSIANTNGHEKPLGFEIDLDTEVAHTSPFLLLNDQPLINRGEIFVILALPGSGKTQLCAGGIASGFLDSKHNISCDSLGISFNGAVNRVLYIDTERTKDDNTKTYKSIAARLDIETRQNLISGNTIKDLDYWCMSDIPDYQTMRGRIESLLKGAKYDLLIIDGALDISPGLNDETGCKEAVVWLRSIAVKYDIGLVTTLHPNKGTETAAGHIGGFLYRFCRAMLLIRPNSNNKHVKELTADFSQGKLSHCDPTRFNPSYFTWSDDDHMFTSVDEPEQSESPVNESAILEVLEDFRTEDGLRTIPAARFQEAYSLKIGKTKETARKHLKRAVGKLLQTIGSGKNTEYAGIDYTPF